MRWSQMGVAMAVLIFGAFVWLVTPIDHPPPSPTLVAMGDAQKHIEIYRLKFVDPPPTWSLLYANGEVPRDEWGAPLRLEVPGPNGEPYDIVSYGEDGFPGESPGYFGRYGEDYRWTEVR